MVSSKVEICNLAISHLGFGRQIADFDTEKSEEANACRLFFSTVRDLVLRDFPWGFAKKTQALGLVGEEPTEEWLYAYRLPSDCLFARRIVSGSRNETEDSFIPYALAADDDGTLIYTDEEEAILEYTMRIEDVLRYPPDFVLAFSYLLASTVSKRLIGSGDSVRLGDLAQQQYFIAISKARKNQANEEKQDKPPESVFVLARS